MKRLTRREMLRLMGYSAAGAVLAGCAPATPEPTEPPAAPAPAEQAPTPIPYPEPGPGEEMVGTTQFKKDPPWTFGYANASTSNSFRIFSVAALMWEGQNYPDLIAEMLYTNANDSNPKQLADIEDLLVKGVDGIILAPTSAKALCPALEKATKEGVPVVVFERGIDCPPSSWVSYLDVQPAAITTATTEWVCEQLNYEGKVVLFGIIPGLAIADDHEQAAKAVFDKYPGIELLAFDYSQVSRSKGKEIMEAWLRAYPQIDAVLAWEGTTIQGAVEAVQEAGRFDEIKAWAGKSEQGYLQLVKEGLNGCGYWAYADGSIDCLHALIKTCRGEPVPRHWKLPVELITPDKIDDYVIMDAPATWFPSRIPEDEIQEWLDLAATK